MALLQLRPLALDPVSHLVLPAANKDTIPQDLLEDPPLDLQVVIHLVDPLPEDPVHFPLDLLVEDLKQGIHLVDLPLDLN